MTYEFIQAESANFPVAFSCRVLDVSRSAYYAWVRGRCSHRSIEDMRLAAEVRAVHAEHAGRYGSPRVHRELRARGCRVSRKRVARLMRTEGLCVRRRRRKRRTTDSSKTRRIAPNLLSRDFSAERANQVWVGDVTYVPVPGGFVYLAVLLDLFSRRVVGWKMSEAIDTDLVLGAMEMAVKNRRPSAGLIHHTDRDCRYASNRYLAALKDIDARPSMSRKADCWDNAVAESFFATLEKELLANTSFVNADEANTQIGEYIEGYYNVKRRHSYIDYSTPIEHELLAA